MSDGTHVWFDYPLINSGGMVKGKFKYFDVIYPYKGFNQSLHNRLTTL